MTRKSCSDKIFDVDRQERQSREIFSRGKSGLHRAACRVTPGESNLKDSVTEKKTAEFFGKDEKAGQEPTGCQVIGKPDKPHAEQD